MKQRILLKGPFLSLSGYGYQARFALDAVRSRPDLFDIYIVNTGWGATSWITEDTEIRQFVEERLIKTIHYVQAGGRFDINLQVTIPNEIEHIAPINILYTAGIETTKVSPEWLEKINTVNKSIVVSNHSKQIFKNTSYGVKDQAGNRMGNLTCNTPIDVVNYPVRKLKAKKIDLKLDYDLNLLTMAQWGPRKDIESVIRGFLHEFWEEEIGLVVKTFIGNNSIVDRTHTEDRLQSLLNEVEDEKGSQKKCKIYLLHGSLTNAELKALYTHKQIKGFVTATHGEGYGLSIFESAYNGLPVIAPGWSGQCDFLFKGNKALFTPIKYTLKAVDPTAVWDGVIQRDSSWCYVDQLDLRAQMRRVLEHPKEAQAMAKELSEYLNKEFTEKIKHEEFVNSILTVLPQSDITDDEIDEWLNDMNIDLIEAN